MNEGGGTISCLGQVPPPHPRRPCNFFSFFPLTFCINSFCVCGWMRKVKDGGWGGRGDRVVMEEG